MLNTVVNFLSAELSFWEGLENVGMQLLLWLLGIVESLFEIFSVVSGSTEIKTAETGTPETLAHFFMELPALKKGFIVILAASFGICFICTVTAVIKSIIGTKDGEHKPHTRTVGQAVGSVLVTFVMALVLTVGIGVSDVLLVGINESLNGGEQMNIAAEVIDLSLTDGYREDENNVQGLNTYKTENGEKVATYVAYFYKYLSKNDARGEIEFDKQGNVKSEYYPDRFDDPGDSTVEMIFVRWLDSNGEPYDSIDDCYTREPDPNSGKYIYTVDYTKLTAVVFDSGYNEGYSKNNVVPGSVWDETYKTMVGTGTGLFTGISFRIGGKIRVSQFNFLIAYIVTIVMFISIGGATLGLVKRLFDLVLLFISLPGVCATIPLDDGAKFKLWRETVVSKILLAFGSVIAVNVFFMVAPSIWGLGFAEGASTNSMLNTVLRALLICGGALTISGAQLLFARLIGGDASESREMTQSLRTLLAGGSTATRGARAVGRGLFGFRNANGQRVGGLFKGAAGALGTLGGGAIDGAGTLIGGQAYRNSKLHKSVEAAQRALKGFSRSAGFFGGGSADNPNLGYGISQGLKRAGAGFGGSSFAQNTGLNNGFVGIGKLQSERKHAAARQSARDMISSGTAGIESAYSSAFSAPEPLRADFGREVLAGFEDGAPSTMPAPIDNTKE